MSRLAALLSVFVFGPLLVVAALFIGLVGYATDLVAGGCSRASLNLQGQAMRLRRRG